MADKEKEIVTSVEETPKTETAKAGKRSAKAVKEAEVKVEKEIRKAEKSDDQAEKPKAPVIPARTKLERRSKNYKASHKKITSKDPISLEKAVAVIKDTSTTKFDSTVELHVNLGVDPRHADQNIRETIVLPSGTGKKVKVAVFSDDTKIIGADLSGVEEITALLDKSQTDFDILISTPALMAKLGKYAKILGPRGLMPNPKSGTVTNDINKAIEEAKAGKIEFRVDSSGIIHMGVGKCSFTDKALVENINTVLSSVKAAKPSSVKGTYIKNIYLTTTMGPSVRIDTSGII